MNKIIIAGALASLFAVGTASAEEGFSVGASAGVAQWKVDDPSADIAKNNTGYKLYAGYGFNPFVGLEGGYVSLGKAKFSGPRASGDIKSDGAFLDVVGTLPLPPLFSVFARAGVYRATSTVSGFGIGPGGSASDKSTDIKYGVGAEATLAPFVRGRIEWERYRVNAFGDKGNIDLFSVGLNFNF